MVKIITRSWPLQIALLAILYFIAGKLALLLAVPPGYASSIWPPAGLSVAALLVFGRNRWLGVFIGAFLTSSTAGVLPNSIYLALLIAFGNTAAALVASSLVRRIIQYPKSFYLEKDILLFLVLVGPISALFSASIGTLALLLFDKIHSGLFWINWLHWFIGDSSGGIIFAPLALIFSIKSRKYWLGSVSKVVLPLALCLTLLIGALQYLNKVDGARISEDFHRQAEFSYSLLEKDLNSFQALLGTLQSFYESSSDVSREEFRNFSYHLLSRVPEIHALLWIPVLSERNYSFKVSYAEPLEKNQHFMDRDLSYHNDYKDLILKALRSNKIITSSPIYLEDASGISLALAVAHPRGVLIEVIDPSSVINSLVSFLNDASYQLKIIDMSLPHRPVEIMQAWGARQEPASFNPQLKWQKDLKLGDRTWRLEVQQDPSLRPSAAFNTATFLFTSLIFSFLTCALLLTTANRIITTQAVVDQKTLHLQELNVQLERASKTKSEFLANMSHEIRTPLNVIVGMADLLEEAPLVDQQRRYLEIARKAGDNLLAIINDILDISKIESGLITIEKAAVDVPELVSEVYEMYVPRAQSKRIDFKMIVDENVRNVYLGDATRIRQILNNLLANAFKFTEKGSITLRVSAHSQSMIPGNIIFCIEDTGIGIAPEVIPALFKPFTQADTTITRKFGGTGLGLSICKRLTEMMNGFISVDSQLGRGSTFRFTLTLPFVRPADSRPANPIDKNISTQPVPALRILVVDDADDNRMLIRAYLQGTPHHLMEADNGLQALELVKGYEFDVILMDMQMPGMDGFTTVRRIREFEAEAQRRPADIWALTAYALKAEIQRSLDAGCERHLTKPLRKQELLSEISTYNQSRH